MRTASYEADPEQVHRVLLPYFSRYRLDEIDADACQAFKATKLKESAEIRKVIGAPLCDRRGKRPRLLDPASIRA